MIYGDKSEFWENFFKSNQELWGFSPAASALLTTQYFLKAGLKKILIPGIGYGRNTHPFLNNGMTVQGIEISKTAIELARIHYGTKLNIHHGSVSGMPYDSEQYDGIFCYATLHLLDEIERKKCIKDCFNQLSNNGLMFFAVATKKAPLFGRGQLLNIDYYQITPGLNMFFYDENSIRNEFSPYGLYEVEEVNDIYPFYLIKCRK